MVVSGIIHAIRKVTSKVAYRSIALISQLPVNVVYRFYNEAFP